MIPRLFIDTHVDGFPAFIVYIIHLFFVGLYAESAFFIATDSAFIPGKYIELNGMFRQGDKCVFQEQLDYLLPEPFAAHGSISDQQFVDLAQAVVLYDNLCVADGFFLCGIYYCK